MKSLADYASKASARHAILCTVENLTRNFFKDEDWSNVRKVFAALESRGAQTQINAGTYFHHKEGQPNAGEIAGKEFQFEITAGVWTFQGKLICSFADDKMERYDMAFCLF